MDELPIFDAERLHLVTRGNNALAKELVSSMIAEGDDLVARAERAIASGDARAVSDAGHTLKGLGSELGAPRLRLAGAGLDAARERALWPDCVAAVRRALEELRAEPVPD